MRLTSLEELGWLHDAMLLNVAYDVSRDAGRSIKLNLRCHDDSGYAPWNGKNILLVAINVALMNHFVWGWVTGPEIFDAIRPGISTTFRESMAEGRQLGGTHFPGLEFTISFHSGSVLEVICQELQVEVES